MNQQEPNTLTAVENDVQRYLQLGKKTKKDIQELLEEIKDNTTELGDTTKCFIAHFEVFESLSDEFAENINKSIKKSAHEMAGVVAKGLSEAVGAKVGKTTDLLNTSVREAKNELQYVNRSRAKKPNNCDPCLRSLFVGGLQC